VNRFALLAACGLLLVAGGCGGGDDDSAGGRPAAADLKVTVWPSGPDGPARRDHVVCARVNEIDARCRHLSRTRLAPVPPNVACTEIYGGPATALVRGTLAGEPVKFRFNRINGCEIARWQRNVALFGG
jgi:hypothetical protein